MLVSKSWCEPIIWKSIIQINCCKCCQKCGIIKRWMMQFRNGNNLLQQFLGECAALCINKIFIRLKRKYTVHLYTQSCLLSWTLLRRSKATRIGRNTYSVFLNKPDRLDLGSLWHWSQTNHYLPKMSR